MPEILEVKLAGVQVVSCPDVAHYELVFGETVLRYPMDSGFFFLLRCHDDAFANSLQHVIDLIRILRPRSVRMAPNLFARYRSWAAKQIAPPEECANAAQE